MTTGLVLLLLGGGVLAGFVNTLAGGGSAITLPLLIELAGLPATVANGTNRVAILLQTLAAAIGFRKGGALDVRRVLPLLPALLLGAAAGARLASVTPDPALKRIFAFVIVLVAASVCVKPARWLSGTGRRLVEPWRSLAFLGIGLYGGYVQAGVGFLLLAGLVLGGGLDLVRGNAAKVFLVLLYTPLALGSFILADQVDWAAGLVLAAGNMTGAVLATVLAIRKGAPWIRWILVTAAAGAAAKMLCT